MQNNYTYGQGLVNINNKLFFTPKNLSPAEYIIVLNLDIEKNIYSGIETIIWQNESQLFLYRNKNTLNWRNKIYLS